MSGDKQADGAGTRAEAVTTKRRGRGKARRGAPLWQQFLVLMSKEDLTSAEICMKLNLHSDKVKRLLNQAKYRRAMEAVHAMEQSRQSMQIIRGSKEAVNRLWRLAEGEGETARKACLDLLNLRREWSTRMAEKAQSEAEREGANEPASRLEDEIESLLAHLDGDGAVGHGEAGAVGVR